MKMDIPEKIQEEAALWLAKLEQGLSADEQDRFIEWLMADARNGQQLSAHKRNWSRLDLLADWRPEHSPTPNRDLLAPPPRRRAVRLRRVWLSVGGLAACLALLVLTLPRHQESTQVETLTRIASIERRSLDDGSTIELNRGTELSVFYTDGERRVRLDRGEAHFTVTKDPGRPFVVSVAGIDVVAIGTAFNVRLAASGVEVVVTEGSVRVSAPDPSASDTPPRPTVVSKGELVTVTTALHGEPKVTLLSPQQMSDVVAWQPAWLDFSEVPLASIVEEFNRRNAPIRLLIADRELSSMVVNASLRSDNIENFLQLLDRSFGVMAERNGNTITLRRVR